MFRLAPEPRDLVGFAYHGLALDISMKVPMGACEECGRHFPQRDPRQRFCSSTCAMRARRRRWRERHSLPALASDTGR